MAYDLDDRKTTVIELEYQYGVTQYSKGTGYDQVCLVSNVPHFLIRITFKEIGFRFKILGMKLGFLVLPSVP